MKRENGKVSLITIVCICIILIIAIGVIIYFANKDENTQKSENETKVEQTEKNEIAEKDDKKSSTDKGKKSKKKNTYDGIDLWNGVYEGDNGVKFTIYRSDEDMLTVSIDQDNESSGFDVEYTSDMSDTIEYSGSFFDDEYSLVITRNGDKLEVKSKSDDDDNLIGRANGTYEKRNFENNGWDGVYTNDGYQIILAQYDSDGMSVTIREKFTMLGDIVEDISDERIYSSDEEREFEITKNEDGIVITSSSVDEDSLLNKVSGMTFEKDIDE